MSDIDPIIGPKPGDINSASLQAAYNIAFSNDNNIHDRLDALAIIVAAIPIIFRDDEVPVAAKLRDQWVRPNLNEQEFQCVETYDNTEANPITKWVALHDTIDFVSTPNQNSGSHIVVNDTVPAFGVKDNFIWVESDNFNASRICVGTYDSAEGGAPDFGGFGSQELFRESKWQAQEEVEARLFGATIQGVIGGTPVSQTKARKSATVPQDVEGRDIWLEPADPTNIRQSMSTYGSGDGDDTFKTNLHTTIADVIARNQLLANLGLADDEIHIFYTSGAIPNPIGGVDFNDVWVDRSQNAKVRICIDDYSFGNGLLSDWLEFDIPEARGFDLDPGAVLGDNEIVVFYGSGFPAGTPAAANEGDGFVDTDNEDFYTANQDYTGGTSAGFWTLGFSQYFSDLSIFNKGLADNEIDFFYTDTIPAAADHGDIWTLASERLTRICIVDYASSPVLNVNWRAIGYPTVEEIAEEVIAGIDNIRSIFVTSNNAIPRPENISFWQTVNGAKLGDLWKDITEGRETRRNNSLSYSGATGDRGSLKNWTSDSVDRLLFDETQLLLDLAGTRGMSGQLNHVSNQQYTGQSIDLTDSGIMDELTLLSDGTSGDHALKKDQIEALDGAIQSQVTQNTTDIGTNATNIGANTTNIGTNTTNIGTNTTNIGTNTTNIGTNTTDIGTNASDITDLQNDTIPKSIIAAAGDLIIGQSNDTPVILTKGADGKFLKAGASTISWEDAPGSVANAVALTGVSSFASNKITIDLGLTVTELTDSFVDISVNLVYTQSTIISRAEIRLVSLAGVSTMQISASHLTHLAVTGVGSSNTHGVGGNDALAVASSFATAVIGTLPGTISVKYVDASGDAKLEVTGPSSNILSALVSTIVGYRVNP